jgi:dsDNA-specific endonuclease/ATPase MutS2
MNDAPFPETVNLPLEDSLDLHSFPPQEIRSLVQEYLQEAYAAGFPEVRIIHGKGIGVQREIVRAIAARDPHVESVHQAPEGSGSWGATIVCFTDSSEHPPNQ